MDLHDSARACESCILELVVGNSGRINLAMIFHAFGPTCNYNSRHGCYASGGWWRKAFTLAVSYLSHSMLPGSRPSLESAIRAKAISGRLPENDMENVFMSAYVNNVYICMSSACDLSSVQSALSNTGRRVVVFGYSAGNALARLPNRNKLFNIQWAAASMALASGGDITTLESSPNIQQHNFQQESPHTSRISKGTSAPMAEKDIESGNPGQLSHLKQVFSHAGITAEVENYPYEGSGTEEDPYVVNWIPNDPRNPMLYSELKKWSITALVAIATLAVAFVSSAYSGGAKQVIVEFGCSQEVFTLGISLFVLGFAIGPLLWAPLSELFGRQVLYIGTYGALTAFNAGAAGAKNIETLIILRFFAGAFGSSP
ncbi:hypothetical protein Q7P37_001435 [Cladosporium fusiforme]